MSEITLCCTANVPWGNQHPIKYRQFATARDTFSLKQADIANRILSTVFNLLEQLLVSLSLLNTKKKCSLVYWNVTPGWGVCEDETTQWGCENKVLLIQDNDRRVTPIWSSRRTSCVQWKDVFLKTPHFRWLFKMPIQRRSSQHCTIKTYILNDQYHNGSL